MLQIQKLSKKAQFIAHGAWRPPLLARDGGPWPTPVLEKRALYALHDLNMETKIADNYWEQYIFTKNKRDAAQMQTDNLIISLHYIRPSTVNICIYSLVFDVYYRDETSF